MNRSVSVITSVGAVLITIVVLAYADASSAQDAADTKAQDAAYEPPWESLSKHPVPDWFADAKFGIHAHWGVYSVPAFGNERYPRNMYRKKSVGTASLAQRRVGD